MSPNRNSPFVQHAAEKAQSRAEDEYAVASGEKSREQLRQENGHFAELVDAPILWSEVERLY